MSIKEAFRKTSKGQLQYKKQLDIISLENDLSHLSPPPLSRSHEEQESSKHNLSFGLDPALFENMPNNNEESKANYNQNSCDVTPPKRKTEHQWITYRHRKTLPECVDYVSDEEAAEKSDWSKDDMLDMSAPQLHTEALDPSPSTPIPHPASCPVSPEFGYTTCAILDADNMWHSMAQLSLFERRNQFEDHHRALDFLMNQKWNDVKSKMEQMAQYRKTQIDQKQKEGLEETNKKLQELKDYHKERQKKLEATENDIKRQKEMLENEERERQAQNTQRLQALSSLAHQIEENRQTFIQLQEQCPHKAQLPEIVDKFRLVLDKVCAGIANQLQSPELSISVPEDMIGKYEEHKAKSQGAVDFLKKQIEEVGAALKAQEEKKLEDEKKKADQQQQAEHAKKLQAEAAQDLGVQALSYALKERESKMKRLSEVDAALKPIVGNTQMKTYRFDLQRAVNTPINAISGINGVHLMDKLKRLHALLSGQQVEVSGKYVAANKIPEAIPFCQNLVAKMLVKKGEEQVTSIHESAFAIAAVAVSLWAEFPVVGDLFMAHLQALCPYVLPYYAVKEDGQSNTDYYKSLGYKVSDDGTVEEQDKFLRRMSGLMRLYCACLVTFPPNSQQPHPHGLENAWMWLARTMNMEPHPDITAALIHDVLSVCGHLLFREYKVQFAKLLYALYKNYLPKLKDVSVTSATVGRLEIFLENAMKSATIPLPEGFLPPRFWLTS